MTELDILKDTWRNTIEGDGGYCPCCSKWGKVYKMKLSQHLALCLKWIAEHENEQGWVDVQNTAPRWMLKSKTYNLLAHWGFIESRETRSGVWRATNKGKAFLSGAAVAPSAVYIYNDMLWGIDEQEVSFRQCFGKHFNYDELMSEQFRWANVMQLTGK